ncbi:MAG: transketolase C-terminal domain-containing protein [Bacteroidales bacterium]
MMTRSLILEAAAAVCILAVILPQPAAAEVSDDEFKALKEAVQQLKDFGISVELIDVQSLLPFDRNQTILESLKKTNKIVFFDEDVPGGATAYMFQKVLEEQGGFRYLDAQPRTLTANDHRPAYSTDGDYFSNPNAEDVFEIIYEMMHNYSPARFPTLY